MRRSALVKGERHALSVFMAAPAAFELPSILAPPGGCTLPLSARPDRTTDLFDTIRERALWIRRRSLQMVFEAKQGHPGGDLSSADVLATLYFGIMRYDANTPNDPARDRFVM